MCVLNNCYATRERLYIWIGFRWKVHIENGSPLCLGCELRWGIELQVLPSFLGMLTNSSCFKLHGRLKSSVFTSFMLSAF